MRIRIIKTRKPPEQNIDEEIEWLCSSLGFCEQIDKDRTAAAIFKRLLESTHEGEPLRSDDIAEKIGKSRGAVVNHLNKLINAGLIVRRGTRYELRESNLHNTINEMHRDMERMFQDMEEISRQIDEQILRKKGI